MSSKNLSACEVKATLLGLLLITSGSLAVGWGSPWNGLSPLGGIQAGQTFVLTTSGQIPGPYPVTGAAQTPLASLLTTLPVQSPTGQDFVFAREGGSYAIFPASSDEPTHSSLLVQIPQVWYDSHRKRSRFRTHVEILELLRRGPLSAFEVAFQLRLNSKRTREYLEFLELQQLVGRGMEDKALFAITPDGMALIERARALLFLDK